MKFTNLALLTTALIAVSAQNSFAVKPNTSGIGQSIEVSHVGNTPIVTVKNVAVNKQLKYLKLEAEKQNILIKPKGQVECGGTLTDTLLKRTGITFMSARLGVGEENVAYWDVPAGSSNNLNKSAHSITKTLNVPISAFDGTNFGLDVADLVMKKADQFAQGGGSKLEYFKKDHTYNVQIPIRFQADCRDYTRNKVSKKTVMEAGEELIVATKLIPVQVKYKGDPNLKQTVTLAIAKPEGVGGYDAGEQNFISVQSGKFLEGIKNLKGTCGLDPQFKIELKGAGDGLVKVRVNDGGKTIHSSSAIQFTKGKATYDFSTKVGYGYSSNDKQLNKKYNHNYRIYVTTKSNKDAVWPTNPQLVTGAQLAWNHTCIKEVKLNPSLGLGGTDKIQSPSKPGKAPKLQLKKVPLTPSPLTKKQ